MPDGRWREIFTSDAAEYNGTGVTNEDAEIEARDGVLTVEVPPRGFIVLMKPQA